MAIGKLIDKFDVFFCSRGFFFVVVFFFVLRLRLILTVGVIFFFGSVSCAGLEARFRVRFLYRFVLRGRRRLRVEVSGFRFAGFSAVRFC